MKILKVHEDTHRELKIEAIRDGRPMEALSSDLLDVAIDMKRKGKLKLKPVESSKPTVKQP